MPLTLFGFWTVIALELTPSPGMFPHSLVIGNSSFDGCVD